MPMFFSSLSPATLKTLIWLVVMIIVDYAAVITAIMIDFRSGVLRARRRGIPRTSKGYRRSVDKAARYLVTLLASSAIDAMLVAAAMLFRSTMGWAIPVFPLFTTLCAIVLSLIEGKSVMENTQRRADFTSAAASAADMLSDKELQRMIANLNRLLKAFNDNSNEC